MTDLAKELRGRRLLVVGGETALGRALPGRPVVVLAPDRQTAEAVGEISERLHD